MSKTLKTIIKVLHFSRKPPRMVARRDSSEVKLAVNPSTVRGVFQTPRRCLYLKKCKTSVIILILLTLISLLIRMAFLSSRPPTYDEAFSLALVKAKTEMMVKGSLDGFNPPLYFLLLKLWLKINPGLVWARSFSTLWGVVLIAFFWWTGRKLFDRRTGIAAALLAAFSPVYFFESTKLRMYSLVLLESLLIIYFFLRFLKTQKNSFLISLGLTLLLGLYTQFYFALIVLVLNFFFLITTLVSRFCRYPPRRRKQGLLGKWLLLQISLFLLCLPLLWLFFNSPRPAFYPATHSLLKIPGVLVTFAVAWDATQILQLLPFRVFTLLNIPLLLLTLGLLAAFLSGLKSFKNTSFAPFPKTTSDGGPILNSKFETQTQKPLADFESRKKEDNRVVLLRGEVSSNPSTIRGVLRIPIRLSSRPKPRRCLNQSAKLVKKDRPLLIFFLLYLFLPLGILSLISSLAKPLFGLRSFILFSPAYYLTAALGIARLKKKRLYFSLGAFLLISSLFLAGEYLGFKATWTSTLPYNFVKQNSLPGDIFVHSDPLTFLLARFYLGETNQWAVTESWYARETEAAIGYNILSPDELATKGNRLWYFFSETQYFNRKMAEEKQRGFEENYPKILDKEFKDQDLKISLFDLSNR